MKAFIFAGVFFFTFGFLLNDARAQLVLPDSITYFDFQVESIVGAADESDLGLIVPVNIGINWSHVPSGWRIGTKWGWYASENDDRNFHAWNINSSFVSSFNLFSIFKDDGNSGLFPFIGGGYGGAYGNLIPCVTKERYARSYDSERRRYVYAHEKYEDCSHNDSTSQYSYYGGGLIFAEKSSYGNLALEYRFYDFDAADYDFHSFVLSLNFHSSPIETWE